MLAQHISKVVIAQTIGCDPSTLYRELKRNRTKTGLYRAQYAQQEADERKRIAHRKTVFTDRMRNTINDKLNNEQWSPVQIKGWCDRKGIAMVSHERIYQYIWQDKQQGGKLYKQLRHGSKKYRKHYGSQDKRGPIKDRLPIDQRPDVVAQKARIGDWEMDLIVGKNHQGAVLTIVERKTGFVLMARTQGKKAQSIKNKAINLLAPYKPMVHTITNDNGREFAAHKQIAQKLQAQVYFCNPYASWERGFE